MQSAYMSVQWQLMPAYTRNRTANSKHEQPAGHNRTSLVYVDVTAPCVQQASSHTSCGCAMTPHLNGEKKLREQVYFRVSNPQQTLLLHLVVRSPHLRTFAFLACSCCVFEGRKDTLVKSHHKKEQCMQGESRLSR